MASENLISHLLFNYLKGYIKKLREFLAKPPVSTSPEDKKLKQVALRTNENIQVIIGALEPLSGMQTVPEIKINRNASWFAMFASVRLTCLEHQSRAATILQVSHTQ